MRRRQQIMQKLAQTKQKIRNVNRLNAEAEVRRKKLEAELAEKLLAAEKTIAATKLAAMSNVRTIAAETTAAIVERLIGSTPAPAVVDAAVADVLKR